MAEAVTGELDRPIEIDETEGAEAEATESFSYEISYYPADYTLKLYLDKFEAKELVIPPFQRQYVWDINRASKLIESFLLGLPVPGVFLYKERKTNKLLVIDGQQRILTAVRFITNRFEERSFRLQNVQERWNGKNFEELAEPDQLQVKDAILRATIVQQLDPDDNSSIYHIFERLNTGGLNLSPMEIRKCLYFGSLLDALDELNQLSSWREILGKQKLERRLRDVEFLLRVLAVSEEGTKYEKPMKAFLTRYMIEGRNPLPEKLAEIRRSFSEVCSFVVERLGPKPFHLRGRLNLAFMDAVLGTLIASRARPDDLAAKISRLKESSEFVDTVTRNTSDTAVVVRRLQLAAGALS